MNHANQRRLLRRLICVVVFTGAQFALGAEWQWSVAMPGATSSKTSDQPRAFLWIPPECARVRSIVVAQQTMEEQSILEHPDFRAALCELGFAAVWITPPFDPEFQFEDAGDRFNGVMRTLAAESGYDELTTVPIVPLGHSAAASFPWNFAQWAPQRTLAVISISGQWPFGDDASSTHPEDHSLDGIPGLVALGEYEWADERAAVGLKQRADHPKLPLSMIGESGGGHFDASVEKIRFLALYLRKAAEYRLPPIKADATSKLFPASSRLKPIDPTATGWLADRWRQNDPPRVPAAPVAEYAEPEEAFWFFDEELATAAEKFRLDQRGKKTALVAFVQNGAVIPQIASTPEQVSIPFLPLDDGLTFKLTGAFLDTVPAGRPERWTGLSAGARIAQPANAATISIDRICGPVEKLSADSFAIRFDRSGRINREGMSEIWLAATYPGNREFKRSVQQAVLRFPVRNTAGADQRITFDAISEQHTSTKTIPLHASSSAGAKVYFYVREGPAEIHGDTLVFTSIPPRAKFPMMVTVVAWQWGRSIEPKLKTAEPVERTFAIVKP